MCVCVCYVCDTSARYVVGAIESAGRDRIKSVYNHQIETVHIPLSVG